MSNTQVLLLQLPIQRELYSFLCLIQMLLLFLSLPVSQPVPSHLSVASSSFALPPTPDPSAPFSHSTPPASSASPAFSLAFHNAGILGLSAAYRSIAETFFKLKFPFTRQHLVTHFSPLLADFDVDHRHGELVTFFFFIA